MRLAHPEGRLPNLLFLQAHAASQGSVHLDLAATDTYAEARRLVAAGARFTDEPDGAGADEVPRWSARGIEGVVLLDPDGNEFCIGGLPDAAVP